MFKKTLFALTIIGTITFQNCKPKEEDPVITPIVAPEVNFPAAVKNVDGVLAAIVTITKNTGTELRVGSAHAAFYKGKNPAMKLDAGAVTINSKATTKSDDNTYFYTSSPNEPKGLDYDKQVYWKANGSVANDVPAINDNDGSGFPNEPNVPEFINMNMSQPYLLTWNSSFGADSVIINFKGTSGTYRKVFNNAVTSHSITASEITKLGLGGGTVTVTNYKLEMRAVVTKNYAFIKQCIGIGKFNVTQ